MLGLEGRGGYSMKNPMGFLLPNYPDLVPLLVGNQSCAILLYQTYIAAIK